MSNIIWQPLQHPIIEDGYLISPFGDIRSKYVDESHSYKATYHATNGYDFALFIIKEQYRIKNNPVRLFPIDEIIAMVYIPVPSELEGKCLTVKHINGDTRDISLDNLEWIEDIEIWKDVIDDRIIPNKYQVSNFGNIRDKYTLKPCLIHINGNGYYNVNLQRKNVSKNVRSSITVSLHGLVAKAFYKHTKTKNIVNHIDGIPIQNHVKNLEFVSIRKNTNHSIITNLTKTISHDEIKMIQQLLKKYIYPRYVFKNIDHSKYPHITTNIIANVKRNAFTRIGVRKYNFHPGKMTVDEMDMVRDKLFETDSNVNKAYELLDHNRYPHITRQMIKEIKSNKYSSYNKSNKYDLSKIKFKFTPHLGKLSTDEVDKIRDLLMIHNGSVKYVFNILYDTMKHVSMDSIYDIKRGKGFRRSNKYNLFKSFRYPFILK